jgi:hypothetical protein
LAAAKPVAVATTTAETSISSEEVNAPVYLVKAIYSDVTAMTLPVAALVAPTIVSPALTAPVNVQGLT